MTTDLKTLRQTLRDLASKATPGQWENEDHRERGDWRSAGLIWARNKGEYHPGTAVARIECDRLSANSPEEQIAEFEANAALIAAAASPSNVLALLNALEEAEKALEFYAEGAHFEYCGNYDYEPETASGEPTNWHCGGAPGSEFQFEDGWSAREALSKLRGGR